MKKLLALVLALVMVMGLATVGTNAALEQYSDAEDINYEEAVAVMSAIGVLEGADGKYRPSVQLKRSEAAKIVAYLNTNNRTAESLVGTGAKFTDVPANHWAAGYIEYLASVGIMAGNGDSTLGPDGDLTAVAFAKMLLVALGYDPKVEGLVGNDYIINATKLATDAFLFNGLPDLKPNDVLTREQAAQMAFNAVKSPLVEYSNKGGSISINGADISLGASSFNYVTTTIAKDATNISRRTLTNSTTANTNTGYTVEFGERHYPELVLREVYDDFGRPASEWTYGKEMVGKFVNWDLQMGYFTTAVTGADLYNLIGEAKIKNSDEIIYKVNGAKVEYVDPAVGVGNVPGDAYKFYGVAASNMIRSNKVPYAFTGNGVLTEVYEKEEDLIIVSIFTYYAEPNADYNQRTDRLNLTFSTFGGSAGTVFNGNAPAPFFSTGWPAFVKAEDIPAASKYSDGDPLLVRVAYEAGQFHVAEIMEPRVEKAATISKFSTNAVGVDAYLAENGLFYEGYIVAGGNTQNYSKAVFPGGLRQYDKDALDSTFNVVYDPYDYVIYTKANTASAKYVFIAGVDNFTSNLGMKTAQAFAIFDDGTSGTIYVNVSKSDQEIEKYETIRRTGFDINGDRATSYETANNVDEDYSIRYDSLSANEPLHAYNRWFSYSVSGEGANAVYTLYPAGNSLMVAQKDSLNPADKNGRVVVNPKGARLIGDYTYSGSIGVDGGPTVATGPVSYRSAWGNDNSVYITVNTARVSASDRTGGAAYHTLDDTLSAYKRGIAEVTGIYTGVQNVDLIAHRSGTSTTESTAKELNPFPEAVYAVYNKNSKYIIAAVVVGSDNASTDSYIYAVSDAGSEWKEGSYYYWDFNAIVDGEETVLTVKDQYGDTIKRIQRAIGFAKDGRDEGALFSVRYDKDNYVTEATQVRYDTADTVDKVYANAKLGGGSSTPTAYAKAFDKEVVYETYFAASDTYYVIGNTLYNRFNNTPNPYEQGSDIGLTIANGAPIYVVYQERVLSTRQLITRTERFGTFKGALGAIADNFGRVQGSTDNHTFNGYVSAALNSNGTAKWVVMKSLDIVNMENNTGSSNSTLGRAVYLSDYNVLSGFTVTYTGFNPEGSYSYKILKRGVGQDAFVEAKAGTVKLPAVNQNLTFNGGVGTTSLTWADNSPVNIHLTIESGAAYIFVLDGIESLPNQAD